MARPHHCIFTQEEVRDTAQARPRKTRLYTLRRYEYQCRLESLPFLIFAEMVYVGFVTFGGANDPIKFFGTKSKSVKWKLTKYVV